MTLNIVKVDTTNRLFRLVIPRNIIRLKRWHDVKYVLIEDNDTDNLIIRRFVDGKALKDSS